MQDKHSIGFWIVFVLVFIGVLGILRVVFHLVGWLFYVALLVGGAWLVTSWLLDSFRD